MTPHLVFWALALVLLTGVAACVYLGWQRIRHGLVAEHRQWMNRGGALVVTFLLLYVAKLFFIGREDLSTWSSASLMLLYVHETFIAIMLVATSGARWISRRLLHPDASPRLRRTHRWFGRVGAIACLCGLGTAIFLFVGMLERAQS